MNDEEIIAHLVLALERIAKTEPFLGQRFTDIIANIREIANDALKETGYADR